LFASVGVFEMRQIEVFRYEQHLSQCVDDFLEQMAELEKLRELVRSAEAAKALRRPKGLVPGAASSKNRTAPAEGLRLP
jgi:hypothetical protein